MNHLPNTPESIKENVRAYYGARAQQAEQSCCGDECCGSLYSPEELALVPPEAASSSLGCGNPTALAGLQPGEVVLDLGSGGGLDVFLAAQRVGPQGFVYGVDMTDEMLALARRNAARLGIQNVEFRKGDIEDLPLPDASVDVILSNCVINLSPHKDQTLNEAFRVLRPGGRLAISDIVIDGDLADLPVSEAEIRQALSWAGCIAGALTMDQYRQLLDAAGFQEIEIQVQHRYTLADLAPQEELATHPLPRPVLEALVGRFTSSAITARRPL
ncbi:arsenite methyltransferase [Litorilinea aerophila]|uniref:Arsenite methyltransferase n=1 Tax=Litorilinea aerophila TaxID=1204385 RepID=A0A540VC35_9CHLR|nr:arsenite methyltransferase [Litorilinea aerophila]MCC9077894.1 arsenite methyltransferase [Litorilinea aerophila]GIV78247.1 MAG: arsenite S-adenosylmethyltransferase [Litorilinea sp.]